MIKKIVLTFLLFLGFINIVNAGSKYNYVCDNSICYNTKRDFISNDYYLLPVTKLKVSNFLDYIDNVLNDYSNYYDTTKYVIDGYCTGSCKNLVKKKLTFSSLIAINTPFSIGKTSFFGFGSNTILASYDSGKDYLFSNFTDVITSLHSGFPIGEIKSQLSDIIPNILYYSNNNFTLRNVCNNTSCSVSSEKNILLNDGNAYDFVSGTIKNSFKNDVFVVSDNYNISSLVVKAGQTVNFNFGFEDYLDQLNTSTEYEYRIYYNYEGDGIPNYDNYFLKENIFIDSNNYNISSPNIKDSLIPDFFDLKVLNDQDKKVRVGIKEGIKLTKTGKINFYLSVKNISTGDKFNTTLVNKVPLLVIPNDELGFPFYDINQKKNITKGSFISKINTPFTPELNTPPKGFNANAPFTIEINVLDEFGNQHFDNINGYDISISNGSSSSIELSSSQTGPFSKNITGIKTNSNNSIIFYFRITTPGYHDLNGFNITVKSKLDGNNYISPIKKYTLEKIIPSNLYNGTQKMKIYIKAPVYTTLPVSCGQTVTVNFYCTGDNFSGCNIFGNTNKIYTKESENNTVGQLSIVDNAFNNRIYTYTMNHVDRTAPVISVSKGISSLNLSNYTYIANSDDLKISSYEWTTSSCEASANYLIKRGGINGTIIYNKNLLGIESNILISNYFTGATLGTNPNSADLYIKATDKYGNFSEKTIKFTINPDLVDEAKSTVNLINSLKNSKFGDNFDKYEYYLYLKDKYKNPIYNKQIEDLQTDCSFYSGCNNLKTILGDSGNDALIETYDNITDINGLIKLTLKSLVPGKFKEVFKIKMEDWDKNYIGNGNLSYYSIGSNSSINSFKIPVKGDLTITEGGSKPVLGKEQKYNIKLTRLSSNLNGYTNGSLNLTKNTIINKTEGHFWNKFTIIDNFFGDKLSTLNLGFSGSIDADSNVLSLVELGTNKLDISYEIGGKVVKYFLDDFGIKGCNVNTLGLKIIGNIQGNGKSEITGQKANFSDISKLDIRTKIRINGFNLKKGLISGKILNKVKYVEGDTHISGNNLGYETLIVYNGNVIIDGDLNINGTNPWNKLGIIVLKDNYLTNSDYNKSGNVYVNKDVKNINAIIYADGGFFSSKSDGTRYQDIELNNLLTLNGSLFTRNTVGGAVKGNSSYTLPGGKTTSNYNLAEIYDLNYIRKVDNNCSLVNNYSFLIKYDSKVQIDPPIGFKN